MTTDAPPTVRYETRDRKAYLTLNRPDRLNAIDFQMPGELAAAVRRANADPGVHVIVLQGAGRAFCSGYDLKLSAEDGRGAQPDAVWDPIRDYATMKQFTDDFFTLWRSLKPTIAKVHGFAVAGGSDIALSCDLVVMAEDARIGYMPARVWGCPTTAMWVYRLGAERAKRMLLTGDTIDGRTAADWGLTLEAVPPSELDARVEALADRIAGVPVNQLAMQKLMINQAYDNMGLHGTQILATLFDGITRHSPEGRWFQQFAAAHGFHEAVRWRDSGRWIPDGGGPVPTREDLEDLEGLPRPRRRIQNCVIRRQNSFCDQRPQLARRHDGVGLRESVIDVRRLAGWMDDEGLPGHGEPIKHRLLSGGTQNQIYEISRGELRCAMRIPPPSAPADRDAGILREWRIIEALTGTDVPCPPAVARCADTAVLGRPFYLMGFVDGWSPMDHPGWPAPFDTDAGARQGLAYQMAEGIALVSRVGWKAKGLHDLGRPDGFHERQVDRWTAFLDRIKGRELPGFDEAAAWLRAHRPLDYIPGLMHGDYQFANVMFRHGAPARLAAIVDWEMGTVGDPKLDLGWMLQGWPDGTGSAGATFPFADLSGMPSRPAVLARYAEVSGRQVDDIDYYIVLAKWKFAVVLEQGFQRAGDDVKLQAFGPMVLELMQGAATLAESTDYRS